MVIGITNIISSANAKVPTRLNIAIMLFMACLITYMLRVNLSINIIAMVKPRTTPTNTSTLIGINGTNHTDDFITSTSVDEDPDLGPKYDWSVKEQSHILGAYFWGSMFTSLVGGLLAEKFGGRLVVGISLILSAITTAIMPPIANFGFLPFYIARFVLGLLGGLMYPALHSLISKWAPPNEKGKFVSSLLGGTFGTVITWPICGILLQTIGWPFAFYIPAILTATVALFWFYIVSDTPNNHPRICREERDFINKSLVGIENNKKSWPPVLDVIRSIPFYGLTILHYGNMWGLFFLLTAAPKYMSEVLGFKLAKAGLLSALPYLARMTMGFAFGSIGDLCRKREWMGVTAIRKFFCIFSHIIPGLFLIGLTFAGTNPYICVTIITLSLGFNGSATVTNLQNSQDLAPNFAGTLYGIINFVGTTTGFVTPLIVAHFTAESNTIDDWSNIFIIGAIAYIIPALIFTVFGSGNVQPWNNKSSISKEDLTSSQEKYTAANARY